LWLSNTRPEEWLLIEWPDGEKEPMKGRGVTLDLPCRRALTLSGRGRFSHNIPQKVTKEVKT
jgi:hypothetical protein